MWASSTSSNGCSALAIQTDSQLERLRERKSEQKPACSVTETSTPVEPKQRPVPRPPPPPPSALNLSGRELRGRRGANGARASALRAGGCRERSEAGDSRASRPEEGPGRTKENQGLSRWEKPRGFPNPGDRRKISKEEAKGREAEPAIPGEESERSEGGASERGVLDQGAVLEKARGIAAAAGANGRRSLLNATRKPAEKVPRPLAACLPPSYSTPFPES